MYCLSVQLPWALLIVAGRKSIEVRSWSYRSLGRAQALIGQRVAIHCGQGIGHNAPANVVRMADEISGAWQGLRGNVIGSAVLVAAFRFTLQTWEEESPNHLNPLAWWGGGLVGLQFREPLRLNRPVPCRGQLGFFDLPAEIIDLVREARRTCQQQSQSVST